MLLDYLGHFSTAKTSSRDKERFFWPLVSGHKLERAPKLIAMPEEKTPISYKKSCNQSSVVALGK